MRAVSFGVSAKEFGIFNYTRAFCPDLLIFTKPNPQLLKRMLTFGHCSNHLNPTTHSHDSSSPKPPRYSEPQQSCLFFYKQQVLQGHQISLLASSEPLKASSDCRIGRIAVYDPIKSSLQWESLMQKKAVHCLDNLESCSWRTFNTSTIK
mgnify:CR=1 FL=1